jgi:hypothetical protein
MSRHTPRFEVGDVIECVHRRKDQPIHLGTHYTVEETSGRFVRLRGCNLWFLDSCFSTNAPRTWAGLASQ